jgi:hypothetical protein
MVLLSIVTAPFKARARPSMLAPVFSVMEVAAIIVPEKTEFTPRVAELPTCQKMFPGCAPLIRLIMLPTEVMRVDPA